MTQNKENIRSLCFLQLLKMKAKEVTGAEVHEIRHINIEVDNC